MNTKAAKKEASHHRRHLMPTAAAAEYLGDFGTNTLEKWRHFGTGPAYIKIGNRVFYDQTDLDSYIDAHRRLSTSEAAAA